MRESKHFFSFTLLTVFSKSIRFPADFIFLYSQILHMYTMFSLPVYLLMDI